VKAGNKHVILSFSNISYLTKEEVHMSFKKSLVCSITVLIILCASIVTPLAAEYFYYNGDTYLADDLILFNPGSASGYTKTTGPSRTTCDVKAEGRFVNDDGSSTWGYDYDFGDTVAYVEYYSNQRADGFIARNSVVNSSHTQYLKTIVYNMEY
jgi:hypothetical protein